MPLVMIKSDKRAREKPCLRCEYSLRRLGDATHCPECGLSVWVSLNQNDSLDWSRPEWLGRMVMGLWLMAAAQVIGMAPYLLAVVMAFAQSPGARMLGLLRAANLCALVYLIVYHLGLVWLTWPERRYPDRLKGWRIGSWAACGLAALVALVLVVAMTQTDVTFASGLNVVLLASGIVTLGYLRQLAKRIPNSTLAKICAWLMLLPLLSFLKVFPFVGVWLLYQMLSLGEFLPILYLPASAVLFVWFSIILRRAAPEAEMHWAAETAITR